MLESTFQLRTPTKKAGQVKKTFISIDKHSRKRNMTVQNFQQIIVRSKLLNLLLLEFIFLQYLHYLALSLICFLLRKISKNILWCLHFCNYSLKYWLINWMTLQRLLTKDCKLHFWSVNRNSGLKVVFWAYNLPKCLRFQFFLQSR